MSILRCYDKYKNRSNDKVQIRQKYYRRGDKTHVEKAKPKGINFIKRRKVPFPTPEAGFSRPSRSFPTRLLL